MWLVENLSCFLKGTTAGLLIFYPGGDERFLSWITLTSSTEKCLRDAVITQFVRVFGARFCNCVSETFPGLIRPRIQLPQILAKIAGGTTQRDRHGQHLKMVLFSQYTHEGLPHYCPTIQLVVPVKRVCSNDILSYKIALKLFFFF